MKLFQINIKVDDIDHDLYSIRNDVLILCDEGNIVKGMGKHASLLYIETKIIAVMVSGLMHASKIIRAYHFMCLVCWPGGRYVPECICCQS